MSKTSDSITLGVGDLSVNGEDVGYLSGSVTVTTQVESQEFRHGTHQTLVKRIITTLSRSITANLAQIDISTLRLAMGIGTEYNADGLSRLNFGTSWQLPVLSNVKFTHTRDDGQKVIVFFPKAQVRAESSDLEFSPDNFLAQNIVIDAVEDLSRPDCPLGFIQVGSSESTDAPSASNGNDDGGGNGGDGEATIEATIVSVTDEAVTYDNSDPHYTLAHHPVVRESLIVKSSDGSTTYTEGTDYGVDYINGNIFAEDTGSIASESNLSVSYSYASNAVVATAEEVAVDQQGYGLLAHSPVYGDVFLTDSTSETEYAYGTDYTIDYSTGAIHMTGANVDTVLATYAYLTAAA